jgi:hypothetical protein
VSKARPEDPWRDDDDDRAQKDWADAGFAADQARDFRRWRFTLAEAIAWRHAGVADGVRAAQWVTAGATPESVSRWRAAGIDASQAVHWHEMGFDLQAAREARRRGLTPEAAFAQRRQGPGSGLHGRLGAGAPTAGAWAVSGRADLMRKLQEAGVPPRILHGYLAASWEPDDALPWAAAGIEAAEAGLWRMLGLTAQEAGRLVKKGADAIKVVRDWWRAGIPFDEVAEWIGAGLSAEEAAAQRARGITAEQAAALRALRDQDTDD